jgi:hypothetical protein
MWTTTKTGGAASPEAQASGRRNPEWRPRPWRSRDRVTVHPPTSQSGIISGRSCGEKQGMSDVKMTVPELEPAIGQPHEGAEPC